MRRKTELPELLSPAGDFECLVAAVMAGADAVYVGGKRFGARAFAGNFDDAELADNVGRTGTHIVFLRYHIKVDPGAVGTHQDALGPEDHAVLAGVQLMQGCFHLGGVKLSGSLHTLRNQLFQNSIVDRLDELRAGRSDREQSHDFTVRLFIAETFHKGRIFFPVAEPFGEHLRQWIEARGGKAMADKYVFEELYDTTKTAAKQMAEKNKFLLTGQYKGSAANEIDLGATNIAPRSVVVTAGGVTLVENTDYIQFGEVANFVDIMSAAQGIPHLDQSRYPSVQKWKIARSA